MDDFFYITFPQFLALGKKSSAIERAALMRLLDKKGSKSDLAVAITRARDRGLWSIADVLTTYLNGNGGQP